VPHAATHVTAAAVQHATAAATAADSVRHVTRVTPYAFPPLAWLIGCVNMDAAQRSARSGC
jgi:hypothetical protein